MLEIIDVILGFGGGLLLSWALHRSIPCRKGVVPEALPLVQTISNPVSSPVPSPGPDRVYVRFEFADGRVEVKKFNPLDLDLEIMWKNRKFAAGEWTADGHIYREVVG